MKPIWAGLALCLAACASTPPPAREPQTPDTSSTAPDRPSPLAAEQRWLSALFKDTPVRVAGGADGSVHVSVPLRYAFASHAHEPLPPLHAVLERLASSLQRQGSARLAFGAPEPDARARALAVRRQLQALGIAGYRVQAVAPAAPDSVSLRLVMAPAAIERLDDPPASR